LLLQPKYKQSLVVVNKNVSFRDKAISREHGMQGSRHLGKDMDGQLERRNRTAVWVRQQRWESSSLDRRSYLLQLGWSGFRTNISVEIPSLEADAPNAKVRLFSVRYVVSGTETLPTLHKTNRTRL
jgi:hypothetical protein